MSKKSKGLFSPLFKWLRKRTNTERVTWVCLLHGFFWVDCSYLLAYLGREEIAQTLSEKAITEIIGVVLIYSVKEGIANYSKYHSPIVETTQANEEEGRTI